MTLYNFDDSNIRWNKLGDFEHLLYSILDIDENSKIIDVLFKFAANQQIVLHRHKAQNNTFVIQGEHRLYEANGKIKEIRPAAAIPSAHRMMSRIGKAEGIKMWSSFSVFVATTVCYTKC